MPEDFYTATFYRYGTSLPGESDGLRQCKLTTGITAL